MTQWLKWLPWFAGVVALTLGTAGCGQSEGAPHAQASDPAQITVHSHVASGGPLYFEGALPQFEVRRADGTVAVQKLNRHMGRVSVQLPDVDPGVYTFSAGQRPCDGNCGYLDGLTDTCRTSLNLTPGPWTVYVTFHVGRGCELRIVGPDGVQS